MDLEFHFNADFIHFTAAEGYVEMLCYPSAGVSLPDVLCFRISIFPLSDCLRVLIEWAKHTKIFMSLGRLWQVMQW